MIARSYLFVPADRPERIAKALSSGADAVIVDLEDAVAPSAKNAARAALAAALRTLPGALAVVVRVNAADTVWFAADLAVCATLAVQAVMLPKAGQPDDLATVARALPGTPIIPLIETAEGYDRMREIARGRNVERLAFGTIDFQLDLGLQADDNDDGADPLSAFRARFVLESRLARLSAPVDGVTTSIDDVDRVARAALAARRMGFGAKLCIHPKQVAAVNKGFTPGATEIDWARRVMAAARDAAGAAVAVDGKMVDRPVLLRATALLRQAGVTEGH